MTTARLRTSGGRPFEACRANNSPALSGTEADAQARADEGGSKPSLWEDGCAHHCPGSEVETFAWQTCGETQVKNWGRDCVLLYSWDFMHVPRKVQDQGANGVSMWSTAKYPCWRMHYRSGTAKIWHAKTMTNTDSWSTDAWPGESITVLSTFSKHLSLQKGP